MIRKQSRNHTKSRASRSCHECECLELIRTRLVTLCGSEANYEAMVALVEDGMLERALRDGRNTAVASRCGVNAGTVTRWRDRAKKLFAELREGLCQQERESIPLRASKRVVRRASRRPE
jgi:hypothetical protein